MSFDYRQLEADADRLQKRAGSLAAKQNRSAEERDELMSLQGQIHALEDTAGRVKEAELVELRASIARGTAPVVGGYDSGDSRDFYDYLRTGDLRNAALSTTDANGGYIVPEPLHAGLIEKVRLIDGIFGNAAQLDISGGDSSIMLPYKSGHGQAVWAGESAARSEQTEPVFTSAALVCYELYSDQRATQQVVDSIPNFEQMMLGWLYGDIYEALGSSIATGDGNTQAVGLFTEGAGYTLKASTSASAVLNTNAALLYFALNSKYRPNAKWYANGATIAALCAFANPANDNLSLVDQSGEVFTMLGKPLVEVEGAPAIDTDHLPLAFGDLSQGYMIATHRRPTVLVDPYTASPKVRYSALSRLGGAPWDKQAVVLLKCCSTL